MSLIHKNKRLTFVYQTVSESLVKIVINFATVIVSDIIKMSTGMEFQNTITEDGN